MSNGEIVDDILTEEIQNNESQELSEDQTDIVFTEDINEPIESLFKNYVSNKTIVEKTIKKIGEIFSVIKDRGDVEEIWDDNDKMFRCLPIEESQQENRANFGAGEYHIAINQLQSMTYKVITENPNSYKFEADDTTNYADGIKDIMRNNANILNKLLYIAFGESSFKKQLRRIIHDFYKYANCSAVVEWKKQITKCPYKNKSTNKLEYQDVLEFSLPMLFHERIDQVWFDQNIDDITEQPAIFMRRPVTWNDLIRDEKAGKIVLPKFATTDLKNEIAAYKETVSTEFDSHKSESIQNSERDYSERTRETFKHWVCYIYLPISFETNNGKWDESQEEILCRVRFIGDPSNCKIIEIRESPLPGGVPVLWASQTADNIGMYSISLGEKVKTFYEQLCTAYNQEVDNRAKNTRRPIVYDYMRGEELAKCDFGHSNAYGVEGNPHEIFAEMQIADMTQTIQLTKNEMAYKIKEITNTTEAVTGQAMGGRTSASEYSGAKIAATTPIFSDMAQFESDIIVGYMRKFAAATMAYLTHEDIVDMIGDEGKTFNFSVSGRYKLVARGVVDAMETNQLVMNLMQLLAQTQDANVRNRIMLRIAEAMKLDNPQELVPKIATDQAVKAALFENNEMLVYGKQDAPESGEPHDIHLAIHKEARWTAVKEKNPNIWIIDEHINATEQLKSQDKAAVAQPFPVNGQQAGGQQLAGLESGQQISAQLGNINGGSQMPMS